MILFLYRQFGEASDLVPHFRSILDSAADFSNIQIVFISMIPSVLPAAKKRFSEANTLLKNLVKEKDEKTEKRKYENATFFNMCPTLSPSGKIAPVYFKSVKVDQGRQRNVHLSRMGAHRLAFTIFDHCTRFVINRFK